MKQFRFLLLFFALTVAIPSVAQVWTLEVIGLPTDTSIVRCYGSQALVYNYSGGGKGFLLLDEYTTSTDKMNYNSVDSVADMKIVGNTVYFCGRINNGSGNVGFVGFFDITSYPNAYATAYQLPQFVCIDKLVFSTFSTPSLSYYHLMMIGTKASGLTSLIDVALTPTWSFAVHDSDDDIFLDVDQTRDYVIVTSRHDKSDGHVWTFFKASPTGNYFFDYPYIRRAQNPPSYPYPYLIEPDKDSNGYVVTSRPDASRPLYITNFIGPSSYHTYETTSNGQVVRDLNYNPTSNTFGVLVDIVSSSHSCFHIPPMPYPLGGFFSIISSNDITVFHSIDDRPVNTDWFAVSGKNNASNLGLFLYNPNSVGECLNSFSSRYITSNEKWNFIITDVDYYSVFPTIETLKPDGKNYPVRNTCVSKTENQ